MTVILGIGDGQRVVLGADSIAIAPDSLICTVRHEPKLFHLGDHLIAGYAGSFAIGDAIRFGPVPPPPEAGVLPEVYIHDTVLPAFRAAVEEADLEGGIDEFRIMVGYAGRAFLIEGLRQLGSSIDGVEACGAGDTLAIGAALALADAGLSDEERVLRALAVAGERSAGVRGPFRVLCLPS